MTDVRVLHGNPTDTEVAALVVALTPSAASEEPAGSDAPAIPAWTRAALLEGTGGTTVRAPDELAARPR